MSVIVPPGYLSFTAVLKHDADPDPWNVTWGSKNDSAEIDPTALGALGYTALASTIALQMSPECALIGVSVRVGQDGEDDVGDYFEVQTRGTVDQQMLPQNCAALYKKVTGKAGRRNQGRFFFPNVLQDDEVDATGSLSSGLRADLQFQAVNFLGELADADIPMVILHGSGGAPLLPTPVLLLSVDTVISTQRRRLR